MLNARDLPAGWRIAPLDNADYALVPDLVLLLEPELSRPCLEARQQAMLAQGWRCLGAWRDAQLAGIAGYSLRTHFFSGPVLFVENVVLLPETRGQGIGRALMDWLEAYARSVGAGKVTLDAYQRNLPARRFYEALGYDPRGVHFVKDLPAD